MVVFGGCGARSGPAWSATAHQHPHRGCPSPAACRRKNRVGSGHEAQRLHCLAHLLAPADRRTRALGMVMRATAITRTKSNGSMGSLSASGVPGTRTRLLMGTDSGWLQVGQLRNQARTVHQRLAHAHNAAAAHADACSARSATCPAGPDKPGCSPRRCSTRGRCPGCGCSSPARRLSAPAPGAIRACPAWRAGLQAQAFHGANQGADFFNVAVFAPPGGAHAKAGGACVQAAWRALPPPLP